MPNYLDYEIAILQSNISACHLKLEDWKAAVDSATKSLDSLEKLLPQKKKKKKGGKNSEAEKGKNAENGGKGVQDDDDDDDDTDENGHGVVEISGDDASAEKQLRDLQMSDSKREDVRRIRVKALMRRAKGRMEQGGWGNLAAAEEGMYFEIPYPTPFYRSTSYKRSNQTPQPTLYPQIIKSSPKSQTSPPKTQKSSKLHWQPFRRASTPPRRRRWET